MQWHSDTVTLCHIGKHGGLWFYTIGERGGFEIDKKQLKKIGLHPEKMGPLYVIGKNTEKNQLIVGGREETMRGRFEIDCSGRENLAPTNLMTQKLWVRIRNLGELNEVSQLNRDTVTQQVQVTTLEPLFGVAEGQSAVFYDAEGVLVGGGIIV